MEYTSSLLILVLLVLIARESREGTRAIKSDPSVQLKSNERFRTLRISSAPSSRPSWPSSSSSQSPG